jgi:hypothetical protein
VFIVDLETWALSGFPKWRQNSGIAVVQSCVVIVSVNMMGQLLTSVE